MLHHHERSGLLGIQLPLRFQVGDRILAVNGQVVTDQQSAVNYVKSSGPRLVLQLARPRPDCMDLATGHIR